LLWCRGCTTSPPLCPLLPSVHGAPSSTGAVTAYISNTKNENSYAIKIAPQSPWQNPYCERVIGSIRRDVLDHVIVLNERHLHRVLRSYMDYYHAWRVHRSLDMDAPDPRLVQPPELGSVMKLPEVGGLHHHYERKAA